jgi:MFS family permease
VTGPERTIVAVTFAGHVLCHASVLVVTGLLIPLKREFDLSAFWVTMLPLVGYILMGLGALPAGLAVDRWGTRRVLGAYFLLTGVACGMAATAPNAWVFAGALSLLGAAVSLYHPTGLTLISHGVRRCGLALGIHGIAGSLGLAGSSFGLLVASMGSWRIAYWIICGVAFVLAAAFWVLAVSTEQASHESKGGAGSTWKLPSEVFKLLVLLYVAMALSGFNYRSLMTALPTYLTAASSGVYAGVGSSGIVFAVFLFGGLGQFLSGRFADRFSPVSLYVFLVTVSVPLALLLAFSAGIGRFGAGTAMALALFHFGTQPVENLLIARHTPSSLRGMSYGLKFLVTFGLGALGAPVVGYFWERTGTLAWTFVIFAGVAVVVASVILRLARAIGNEP